MTSAERTRRYREKHPERVREARLRRAKTPEQKAYMRDWIREDRQKNPDRYADRELRKHYGITLALYEQIFTFQNGRCAICQTTEAKGHGKRLSVDHCHKTQRLRGLLCNNCNNGLGRFLDDPALLRAAILYLERHTNGD